LWLSLVTTSRRWWPCRWEGVMPCSWAGSIAKGACQIMFVSPGCSEGSIMHGTRLHVAGLAKVQGTPDQEICRQCLLLGPPYLVRVVLSARKCGCYLKCVDVNKWGNDGCCASVLCCRLAQRTVLGHAHL
jgi:hypothetical protein